MGLKFVEKVGNASYYSYTPDPTCVNWEGVPHFGKKVVKCTCESCGRENKDGSALSLKGDT